MESGPWLLDYSLRAHLAMRFIPKIAWANTHEEAHSPFGLWTSHDREFRGGSGRRCDRLHEVDAERFTHHIVDAFAEHELNFVTHHSGYVLQVFAVARWQQHLANASTMRRDRLLLDAADRQHQAAQADLAGHRQVVGHRAIRKQRHQRRVHGHAGARTVLRNRARGHVDVDVALVEHARVDAEP